MDTLTLGQQLLMVMIKKKSKTGKYISVSIVLKIESSTKVISYYKKAHKIKGIISL